MIRTFISYHHARDQWYKDELSLWARSLRLIDDYSVGVGGIDEDLEPQTIRRKIRDEYLRESQVTILLCGLETRFRKHVDWELKSSMIDGRYNRRSGILVIDLPTSRSTAWQTAYEGEREIVYPDFTGWYHVESQSDLEELYPDMPRRILENLMRPDVKISIVPWDRVYRYPDRFAFLVHQTAYSGQFNNYDLSRKMRMKNFNPAVDSFDLRT